MGRGGAPHRRVQELCGIEDSVDRKGGVEGAGWREGGLQRRGLQMERQVTACVCAFRVID
jgi:hypothetical protein